MVNSIRLICPYSPINEHKKHEQIEINKAINEQKDRLVQLVTLTRKDAK
jgi:hypothetical protein